MVLAKPIKYQIAVPGSKSLMNRALLCAALAKGKTILTNPVYCDDTNYMIRALQQLGVRIRATKGRVTVEGCAGRFTPKTGRIYVGNAGTVMRFLTPLVPAGVTLVGNKRMQQRPLQDLLDATKQLRTQNEVTIKGNVSSQFISALLLTAPTLNRSITITVQGKTVSEPYIAMTIAVMKQFGVTVQQRGKSFVIKPQPYQATQYAIEGDASSATYWWALAALTGSHITVSNIPKTSLQPDVTILPILKKMGCTVDGHTVIGPWNGTHAIQINMNRCPDAVPAVAVAAAKAKGITTITGITHLASKESNRIQVIVANLKKLGVSAVAKSDRIIIHGSAKIKIGSIATAHDHRMAMAFTLLGASVDDKKCVTKSYPSFWSDWQKILHHSKRQTIVLNGMRGSGKTTLGKKLAKLYGAHFIDTDELLGSVADIVKQYGWAHFRKKESLVIKKISKRTNTVIALGGGALMSDKNYAMVRSHYIILLVVPVTELRRRLRIQPNIRQRPSLTNTTILQELNSVWRQRRRQYYVTADQVVFNS